MEDFSKLLRIITGGIDRFEFVLSTDLESVPQFANAEINDTDIVLTPGKEWKQGEADFNSLTLSIKPKHSSHGVLFSCQVAGFLPDLSQAASYNLVSGGNLKYLIIATTKQGERLLIGELENPLTFSFDFDAAKPGGRKGYSFTFKGAQRKLPQFIAKVTSVSFIINSSGELVQNYSNEETFSVDADGKFVVTGPNEADYSIDADGDLVQA